VDLPVLHGGRREITRCVKEKSRVLAYLVESGHKITVLTSQGSALIR
jgi:hypothetical protein